MFSERRVATLPPSQQPTFAAQHRKLFEAMAALVGERGYRSVKIADLVSRAGLSRGTFYDHFDDKEGCFLEAQYWGTAQLFERIRAACVGEGEWPMRLHAALGASLTYFSQRPDLAWLLLGEPPVVAPAARSYREDSIDSLAAALRAGRAELGVSPSLTDLLEIGLIAGIVEVLARHIAAAEAGALPQLRADLLRTVFSAYLGPDQGCRLAERIESTPSPIPPTGEPSQDTVVSLAPAPWSDPLAQPGRLQGGRHSLAPAVVAENQRRRLLLAMAAEAARHGYPAITVADIARSAEVSLRSFYDHFDDREACLLAAIDFAGERFQVALQDRPPAPAGFGAEVASAVAAALAFVSSEPDLADLLILQAPLAGEAAASRYRALLGRCATALRDAAGEDPSLPTASPDLEFALIGGAVGVVSKRLINGKRQRLVRLAPALSAQLCASYLVGGRSRSFPEPSRQGPRRASASPRSPQDEGQRDRLLAAAIEVVAERGYDGATIAQIVAAAHVGRPAFYRQFSGKRECFDAAFDRMASRLRDATVSGVDEGDSFDGRVDSLVEHGLGFLAANPSAARLFAFEYLVGSTPADSRHRRWRLKFARLLSRAGASDPELSGLSPSAATFLIAAAAAAIAERLRHGGPQLLPELSPVMVDLTHACFAASAQRDKLAE